MRNTTHAGRLFLPLALLAGAALIGGCGPGYLHTHAHICSNGDAVTHRHWHPEDGRGGHHAPEGGDPEYHRSMTWGN